MARPSSTGGRATGCLQKIADRHGPRNHRGCRSALGSKYKGQRVGTFGIAAEFSFLSAKVLGASALVVSNDNDSAWALKMSLLRDHGAMRRTCRCMGLELRAWTISRPRAECEIPAA